MSQSTQQQVPEGYKQTEVGVIPDDWELTTIDDVVARGWLDKPMDGNHGNIHPKSADFVDNGVPFIMANNVQNGVVDFEGCSFLRKVQADSLQKGFSKSGDVLLTHKATIGNTAVVGEIGCDYIMLTPQVTYYRVLNREKLDNYYLRHYMDGNVFQTILQSSSGGGTRSYIGITAQRQLPIVIPSKEEQTAIADALSDVDGLIGSLEKLIAKKRAIKTAAMQQLLTGKKRLPPFDQTHTGYKQTDLGEIPNDWDVLTLDNAVDFINGRAYGIHEWETNGVPVIRLQNLTGRGGDYYYSNLSLPEKQYCNKGDLLFMWSATFGPVIWWGEKAIYHYHIWKVECKNKTDKAFLYFTLDDMTEKLKRGSSSGGTMLHVTKGKMESTEIIFPPKNEQVSISNVLSDMDKELEALEQRLNKTQQLKQGMMQELLTGRTRLV